MFDAEFINIGSLTVKITIKNKLFQCFSYQLNIKHIQLLTFSISKIIMKEVRFVIKNPTEILSIQI
jgi:hypothetical protein